LPVLVSPDNSLALRIAIHQELVVKRLRALIGLGLLVLFSACSDTSSSSNADKGVATDQAITRHDGSQAQKDGSQAQKDGSQAQKDGSQAQKDGSQAQKDGSQGADATSSDGPLAPPKACKFACKDLKDCPQGAVDCVNGRCLQCKTAQDCPRQAPMCNAEGRCHQCNSTADCQRMQIPTTCDTQSGMCRQCESDQHCTFGPQKVQTGKCDTKLGVCARCSGDSDCQVRNQQGQLWDAVRCVSDLCLECRNSSDCAGKKLTVCVEGWCSGCGQDSECCPDGKPNCGFTCQQGRCACSTHKQCEDAFDKGQWTCEVPPQN
jgi:hypothetical protein